MAKDSTENNYFAEKNRDEWLENIMSDYGERLTKLAFNYVKDWGLAQDIVQEVFITCYKQYDKASEIVYFKPWIYRITINRCKDMLKSSFLKRYLFNNSLLSHFMNKDLSPEVRLILNSEKEKLSQTVLSLPVKYREVIILFYYEEMTIGEIAELLTLNENTVKTRLKRGRILLKNSLERSE
ncbi:sigma-70 family RNA polymerase sigma factor [Neobacillus notoginsengisoli]|uniref:Sigma-70 family RNA polymerase sigma factor n=1 Tax=Neobacillus notoginsengisoli TaxID=1578198 RepID=A0A417YZL7_9BACI|nr:sigma-70 family RNA polymerase sigma factor [Neobacillus notoginsengisoli]RHW43312.1 sigma-70 family RNA polymerase sigma factor [Neobacillus notoginsengisoli]